MNTDRKARLLGLTALCTRYCVTIQKCEDLGRDKLVNDLCGLLPRIYAEFLDISDEEEDDIHESDYFSGTFSAPEAKEYVDEGFYEEVRVMLAHTLGEEDTYLETFEQDMKYSDTPIAATLSEGLADIFQALYDFVAAVRESGVDVLNESYGICRERFTEYWSQTLCNNLRPLNAIRLKE